MTFDRAGCSSCVNNVIERRVCANKQKHVMWVTTRIRERCEIIYTRPIENTGSLTGVSRQSGVLGLYTVSYVDYLLGVRWGNGHLWTLARKQKRLRCKALKITQRGMVKRRRWRSYGSFWQSPSVSLSLSHIHQQRPLLRNSVLELYFYKEVSCLFLHFRYDSFIHHSFLHYTSIL